MHHSCIRTSNWSIYNSTCTSSVIVQIKMDRAHYFTVDTRYQKVVDPSLIMVKLFLKTKKHNDRASDAFQNCNSTTNKKLSTQIFDFFQKLPPNFQCLWIYGCWNKGLERINNWIHSSILKTIMKIVWV